MKTKIIAIVSIVLNLLLAGVLINQSVRQSPSLVKQEVSSEQPLAPAPAPRPVSAVTPLKFDWSKVGSDDYRKYIANLRAIHCPEQTIRDIIVADVNRFYEQRMKDAPGTHMRFEYWKTSSFFAGMADEGKLARQKEMSRQKRALLKDLLGVDIPEKLDLMAGNNPFEKILDFLPPDKQSAVMEVEQKYSTRQMSAMKDAGKGDYTEIKKIQAEKDAALNAILSADERFEYDLRLSQSAMALRMRMGDTEPTEQEFRALFKVQKRFDDQVGLGTQFSAGERERMAAQKQMDTQFKAILGTERFREIKYGAEFNLSGLKAFAEENKIQRSTILKACEIRDGTLDQVMELQQSISLSPLEKQQALKKICAQAEKDLDGLFGWELSTVYQKKNPWLRNLNPVPVQ